MQTGLPLGPTDPSPADAQAELVLEVLSDATSRLVLTTLQDAPEPMTAQELSAYCDVPLSTMYRKLERLTESRLVEETMQLRASGTHTHQYRTRVDAITIRLGGEDGLDVAVPEGR